jgi:hypothetical protein
LSPTHPLTTSTRLQSRQKAKPSQHIHLLLATMAMMKVLFALVLAFVFAANADAALNPADRSSAAAAAAAAAAGGGKNGGAAAAAASNNRHRKHW